MGERIDDAALDTLFREARTYAKWQSRPVTDDTLHDLYELLKWAPTSANGRPARFAFLRSKEAKERLRPALAPLNIEKTMSAPVTVIIGYDLKFYQQLPRLFPQSPGMVQLFEGSPEMVTSTAKRNSSLQGAYLIMAARALVSIAVRCRVSTRRRSTTSSLPRASRVLAAIRNSSLKGTSRRTSSATSATASPAQRTQGCRDCRSVRHVRCSSQSSSPR